jgi:hypothetical protein
MAYVNVHVDPDEFDDEELIEELESRGYKVLEDGERGNPPPEPIRSLYATYTTMSPEFFQTELKKYFRDHLDVSEY